MKQKNDRFFRLDMREIESPGVFYAVDKLAEQYAEVPGIDEVLKEKDEKRSEFVSETKKLVAEVSEIEKEKYTMWEMVNKKACTYKIAVIAMIILFVISGIVSACHSSSIVRGILSVLQVLCGLLGLVGAGLFAYFKILEVIKRKDYLKFYKEKVSEGEELASKYRAIARKLYVRIDDIYLNSLEPAHREMVMMRRDQERQHQERMELQRAHQRKMEAEQKAYQRRLENEQRMRLDEQKKHEKRLVKEQRKARIAQEELLYIEKEREKERWKYR